jgi:ribosomal protein L24E
MKTAKLLSLSVLTLALSGCVINVKAQRANVSLEESLSLSASSLSQFDIEAGAGSLIVKGDDSATEITVHADIRTTEEKNYVLELDRSGDTAKLVARHNSHVGYWNGSSPKIDLTVTMPANLMLDIDDGSGNIKVTNINNGLVLEDGSGSASLEDIKGDVTIDDGSGDLFVKNVQGNIELEDGSGGLTVSNVTGDIEIDDGSGELTVMDVTGKVTIDDGSGSIDVSRAGSLKIIDSGSGGLSISKIKGEVDIDS